MAADDEKVLQVRDLRVHFPTEEGVVKAVDGLSFDVGRGEIVGIVGESGSGKSVAGKAVMGLHSGSGATLSGEILLQGRDLVGLPESEIRRLRGTAMAMVFQDPMASLHPFFSIGRQISEAYRVHNKVGSRAARERAIDLLNRVGIPDAKNRYDSYPHEFSGGMRQRAMIAMALSCNPRLLIADEPTTALDVTVQAQILELIKDLRDEFGSAVVLITHDLGVVAETCDKVVVMYAGQSLEQAPVADLFDRPEMPYTWGLLGSMPRIDATVGRLIPITGQPPSLIDLPDGCVFAARCGHRDRVADGACELVRPDLLQADPGHWVRCHLDLADRQRIGRKLGGRG